MMKSMIQILLVALIFGGGSAGGSLLWIKLNQKPAPQEPVAKVDQPETKTENAEEKPSEAEATEVTETPPEPAPAETMSNLKAAKPGAKNEPPTFGPPVAARPPFNANADEASELISRLRIRLASSTRQERRVAQREDAMKLILEDLAAEERKAVKLKKQLFDEQNQFVTELDTLYGEVAESKRQNDEKLQAALKEKDEAVSAADEQVKSAREQIDQMRKQMDEGQNPSKKNDRSGSPELGPNLKKAAATLDSMPPEDSATILKESVKEGRIEEVVSLLNAMKPRICSKVISEITSTDAELAADLIERLTKLRKQSDTKTPAAK